MATRLVITYPIREFMRKEDEVCRYYLQSREKLYRSKRSAARKKFAVIWRTLVVGSMVTVVSSIGGNLIVNVKESRVAISREMAQKIMV